MFILAWIVLLIGMYVMRHLWREVAEAQASRFWPLVTGEITQSGIRTRQNDDEPDAHLPDVAYRYVVKGTEYVSRRVKYGSWAATRAEAQSYAGRLSVGQTVDVFHDPSDPSRSVLIPGISLAEATVLRCLGAAFVGIPIFLMYDNLRGLWNLIVG